jgi:serine/threonine protein kinase
MANILVDKKGYLKICDFGLCKRFKSSDDWATVCCGTPTTWAPEVIKE